MTTTRSWRASWVVAMTMLLALLAVYHGYAPRPVALAQDLVTLPDVIGDWSGESEGLLPGLARPHGAHRELSRVYRNAAGRTVHLYLAYFETQVQGRELVSYATRDWHHRAVPFEIPGPGGSILVNRVATRDGREGQVVFFWYDLGGRAIADRYRAKLATVSDALVKRRSNGAMVAVALGPGVGLDGAGMASEVEFLRALLPVLRVHLREAA